MSGVPDTGEIGCELFGLVMYVLTTTYLALKLQAAFDHADYLPPLNRAGWVILVVGIGFHLSMGVVIVLGVLRALAARWRGRR